jgi:PAS domain S-box-containing protein
MTDHSPLLLNTRLISLFKSVSRGAGVLVCILGMAVLFGWAFDISTLKSILPGLVSMKANTAAAFVLSGVALLLLSSPPSPLGEEGLFRKWKSWVGQACAFVVALVGLLTLIEYMTNWNLGIDQLLFKEPSGAVQTAYPGRMALLSALNFLLTGLALLLLDVEANHGRRPAHFLIIVQGTITLLALAGYIHRVTSLYGGIPRFTAMALHTAVGFTLVFIGIMAARPGRGLMAILADDGIAGLTARRLLIAAFVIPLGLDILTLAGERAGLYDGNTRTAIDTILIIGVFAFFALRIAGVLARMEMTLRKANDELENRVSERTAALQSSEEHLRLLIDNVQDYAIIMLNPDGLVVSWNAGVEKLKGYRAEEIIGQHFSRFYTEEDNLQGTPQSLLKTAFSKGRVENEGWRVRKDGSRFMANVILTALYDENGKLRGYAKVTRDITERKRAEEMQRKTEELLEETGQLANVGGWELDLASKTPHWSAQTRRIHEVRPDYQPTLEEAINFYAPEARPLMARAVQEGIEKGTQWDLELPFITATGRRIWVRTLGKAQFENGKPVRLFGAFQEITDRKRAEETIRDYIVRVEQSNRDLEEFAYVASHDLQEPLRKITAFSDRLVSKYDSVFDESGRDYLKRMHNASQRMQTLLNDLLAYSRVATHARPFKSVDLNTVAQHVISDLDARIKQTNGKIVIEALPVIEAESTQMYQLLQNLVANALKYSDNGRAPIINISGQIIGEQCQINVKDNGIGFDVQYLDRIFKAFQRLHSRDKYEGTGMGLAICRRIVERHHGKITATSVPGEGSTFIVTLPVRPSEGENHHAS